MAYASPSPFQHAIAAGTTAAPAFVADCLDPSAHVGLSGDNCDADECDNDPPPLPPPPPPGAPFCANFGPAGPGALAHADARQAPRPPRVRH